MKATEFTFNSHKNARFSDSVGFRSEDVIAFHRSLKTYKPTPFVSLPALAKNLGVGAIYLKDESHRFGLNAFKGVGASYAIYRCIKEEWAKKVGTPFGLEQFTSTDAMAKLGSMTFTSATDGNHGRAVAWTAKMLHQKSVIYVPRNTVAPRIEALEKEGSEVVVVDGNYDEAVEKCAADAEEFGRIIVSDTAWEGYEEIPSWIQLGYTTIFREMVEAMPEGAKPDFLFFQGGVGAFASSGVDYFRGAMEERCPKMICVEPLDAACLLASAMDPQGKLSQASGAQESIMAGLNCGTPSLIAWPTLRDGIEFFLAVDDGWAEEAMRALYHATGGDPSIVSGESGAAGLAGLMALMKDPALEEARNKLGLGPSSQIMLISTEGDTDPGGFRRIVGLD